MAWAPVCGTCKALWHSLIFTPSRAMELPGGFQCPDMASWLHASRSLQLHTLAKTCPS
jgi:hypothetical protein